MSAQATERAKIERYTRAFVVLNLFATYTAAKPKITKLYGQIMPKIKSGGLQLGSLSERYQLSRVFTQRLEPIT